MRESVMKDERRKKEGDFHGQTERDTAGHRTSSLYLKIL